MVDAQGESLILGEDGDPLLHIDGVKASYGRVPVVHGVSLTLSQGESVGLVGHNGVGKTTLLKCLMGLVAQSTGTICFTGQQVGTLPAFERSRLGMSYVPQGRGILAGLTALENLRLAWRAQLGESEQSAIERVTDLFPRLRPMLDRRGGSLSGGEQQILALARALIAKPRLLLLDEPSEGIQPSIVEEIGMTLVRLREREGLTLLMVEQSLDLVLDVAQRIIVMERGCFVRELNSDGAGGAVLSELLAMGTGRLANR